MLIGAVLLLHLFPWFSFGQAQTHVQVAPSSRDIVVDLSGTWGIYPDRPTYPAWYTTIDVPGFYIWQKLVWDKFYIDVEMPPWRIFEGHPEGLYHRQFDVPASMADKKIMLHFEGVNFYCTVAVNGQYVDSHFGGFVPFEMDITSSVNTPSTGNILQVKIIYFDPKLFTSLDDPLIPTGFAGQFYCHRAFAMQICYLPVRICQNKFCGYLFSLFFTREIQGF